LDELWLKLNDFSQGAVSVDWRSLAVLAFQLVIIGYAIMWLWGRIRGTQAESLVKGVFMLTCVCLLSFLFHLTLITSLLQQLIPIFVVSLFIIFQPEIRRGLGHLGRTPFRFDLMLEDSQKERRSEVIGHVISAVRELSRERIGALIVIEPLAGERDYLSPGTTINGDVSSNLLVSIFQPKSPLHDGAIVIRGDTLAAAGVILPITDNPKLSYRYGTRHRAAIGLSEIYDGLCIVVSEETGSISAANRGMLVRYNSADELRDPLSYYYSDSAAEGKVGNPLQAFLSAFNRKMHSGTNGTRTTNGALDDTPVKPFSFSSERAGVHLEEEKEEPPAFVEDVRQIEPQAEH
jgi:diadenylate cyclase